MNPKDILDAWNLLVRAYRDCEAAETWTLLATPSEVCAFWILDRAGMVYPYFTGQGK